ncbi:MAG TPA: hypothetical protein VFR01_06655 [Geobacterales bacterium]|nr:hypothetical protein [Geobacterales bacterium]
MIGKGTVGAVALPYLLLIFALATPYLLPKGAELASVEQAVATYQSGSLLNDTLVKVRSPFSLSQQFKSPFGEQQVATAAAFTSSAPHLQQFRLTFVLLGDRGRWAIINGIPVREGGTIGDRTVTAIERQRVSLSGQGESTWIHLVEP